MQAQGTNTHTQSITSNQSLAAVQTLLKAGLGCITYLRNLLPADNFTESHFTSSEGSLSYRSSDANNNNGSPNKPSRNVSAFRIMTLTRGFTEEADRLSDYLEFGIFDALQKQYLRSFIFAVYLDNKDPNNIVEAYTFNFQYHTIPGTDTTIPIMTLGEEKKGGPRDPVTEAGKKGQAPTLRDVKKSVKTLLRTLINSTTHMDSLPQRRFATFKLFYTDITPPEYEPPHFQAGDADRDKWFFTTHDKDEVPDKWSLGRVETGHHGVNVNVTSVTSYLPSLTENDNAPFTGTTTTTKHTHHTHHTLSPIEEAHLRAKEADLQREDAEVRDVVWAVEGTPVEGMVNDDAEGEVDPEYVEGATSPAAVVDETGYRIISHGSGAEDYSMVPLGRRNSDGEIVPMPVGDGAVGGDGDGDEPHYSGVSEKAPAHVGELTSQLIEHDPEMQTQTQPLESTDEGSAGPSMRSHTPRPAGNHHQLSSFTTKVPSTIARPYSRESLPPSDFAPTPTPSPSQSTFVRRRNGSNADIDMDTLMLQNMMLEDVRDGSGSGMDDTEMLDMETQVQTLDDDEQQPVESLDSIQSFGNEPSAEQDDIDMATPKSKPRTRSSKNTFIEATKDQGTSKSNANGNNGDLSVEDIDNGINCDCGVLVDDDSCYCEGGCGYWFHAWCMGYHSTEDKRLPSKFLCFDCRVRADPYWELIKDNLYPLMTAKFKDLALFRKAIKTAETDEPETVAEFAKSIGCDLAIARQLFKRLESEGFISQQTTTLDDLGFAHTRTRSAAAAKSKKAKGAAAARPRRNMQKEKYVFNRVSLKSAAYVDYFNPDPEVERRLLGLSEMKASLNPRKKKSLPRVASSSRMMPPPPPPPADVQMESQTQDETQIESDYALPRNNELDLKRKAISTSPNASSTTTAAIARPTKKMKVSIAPPVDLAE